MYHIPVSVVVRILPVFNSSCTLKVDLEFSGDQLINYKNRDRNVLTFTQFGFGDEKDDTSLQEVDQSPSIRIKTTFTQSNYFEE